ncbi:low specificity L-threonine aldolase [Mesorhizobium sp. NBSH29]|uniref:threonine aldolase family protein n=1 Tax=Mesorhizobium sp. NBSH29 TaxID=2654249 RepID=UPI001896A25C|nr:low specificity L-threonine aldolase [Mesorhizobium sp. NBSH29]QPC85467.1 low specificity L-threonine aldolase [Mesorhizobium sp. NBSH29]
MNFASDNWAGAHAKIAAALATHATGFAAAYGASTLDKKVEKRFCEIFERDVAVFFVGTGTAANSLALTAVNRPGGIAFAHREAHVIEDECGAPDFFTGGGRLMPVDGKLGRINPAGLEAAIARSEVGGVHSGQPMAVTITQATEAGTVYSLDEIDAIAGIARARDLPFHMDGARFANALVSLGVTPAEMTWKRGVDLLSFGGTKNGCWCAEAIVMFDPAGARDMSFIRKRAAQLFSKSRFIAAQFDAYFEDDLWLETATHANTMAARLAAHITASPKLRLGWQPDANEIFAIIPTAMIESLKTAGALFYDWHTPHGLGIQTDETLCRLVTSFATTPDEVDRFGALIA